MEEPNKKVDRKECLMRGNVKNGKIREIGTGLKN